jgi:hypothetical protein
MNKKTIVLVVVLMALMVSAGLSIDYPSLSIIPPYQISTLVGNISNPHSQANFSNGFVSPNLWNLESGNGNVTMKVYSNASILTSSNLSDISIGYGGVIGYPSEHFTQINGSSMQYMINTNFSSFTSFKIISHTANIPIDMAYDIFLEKGNRLADEVMIYIYKANYNIGMLPFDTFYTTAIVDGHSQNISWSVYESTSTPWWGQMYAFIPSITFNNSMSYKINFSPFFKYLVNNKYVSSNLTVARCGIGSEFGYQSGLLNNHVENLADYSFWMYSYFVLNGIEYQVVPLIFSLAIPSEVG